MQKKNILKSTATGMIGYVLTTIIGFISRAFLIKCLGNEYTGINGLFGNILSMLGIIETGFGAAIIVNLYREVAHNNKEKIKSLLQFYKIVYRIIATVVAVIGIVVSLFLNSIVGEVSITENIQLIFWLYLSDTVMSYLFTYKRSILYANQQNYYINIANILYNILMNAAEILYLLMFRNFIGYLIIKILFRLVENIFISIIADKKYPYIRDKNVVPISITDRKSIFKKVRGLFFHRVAGFVVNGTDNIIISTTRSLGIVVVGLYSNYYLIISVLKALVNQIFSSLSGGIGTLLVEDDKAKSYSVFKTILLMNSWIFAYVTISFYFVSKPFIEIWIGNEFILSDFVVAVLTINFYIKGLRSTYHSFKEAAGIFYEDRMVAVVESIINIVASLAFVRIFGLAGVFIGTITSTMIVYFYTYPKFVYKRILNQDLKQYLKDLFKYLFLFGLSFALVYIVSLFIRISNVWISMVINILICILIPNFIYWIFMHKTNEYKYYLNLILKFINKLKEKKIHAKNNEL